MGFFNRHEGPRLSAEEAAVARLDARFNSWTEPQKEAAAEILIRIIPSLFAQESAMSALPMAELAGAIKEFGYALIPRLLQPEKCLEAVGAAFLTHAESIRGFCCRVVERYKARAAATEATIVETKQLEGTPEGSTVLRLVP